MSVHPAGALPTAAGLPTSFSAGWLSAPALQRRLALLPLLVLRLMVVGAGVVAMVVLAAAENDPAASAEGSYLARLTFATLSPLALVAAWPGRVLSATVVAVTAAVWVLPVGPARGSVVTALLVAAVALALFAWFWRRRALAAWSTRTAEVAAVAPTTVVATTASSDSPWRPVRLAELLGLALAIQALARPGELLLPLTRDAVLRLHGLPLVGIALAAAAAALLCRRGPAAGSAARSAGWEGSVVVSGLSVGLGSALLLSPGWTRDLLHALLVLVLVLAGPTLFLRSDASAARSIWVARAVWVLLAAATVGLAAVLGQWLELALAVAAAGLFVLARPAAGLLSAAICVALVALAVGAAAWLPAEGAASAPLLALGWSVGRATLASGWTTQLRRVAGWLLAALACSTAFFSGYPWLRERPLAAAAETWREIAFGQLPVRMILPPNPVLSAQQGQVIATLPVEHAAGGSTVRASVGRPRGIVIDSNLANAAQLPAGTVVATVELRQGAVIFGTWPLRVGLETAEWAAARPDLEHAAVPAPPAVVSWVPPGGGFFAQRYRTVLGPGADAGRTTTHLTASVATVTSESAGDLQVVVTRAAELPPATLLVLFRIAVVP